MESTPPLASDAFAPIITATLAKLTGCGEEPHDLDRRHCTEAFQQFLCGGGILQPEYYISTHALFLGRSIIMPHYMLAHMLLSISYQQRGLLETQLPAHLDKCLGEG
jgi:hypothetical protein